MAAFTTGPVSPVDEASAGVLDFAGFALSITPDGVMLSLSVTFCSWSKEVFTSFSIALSVLTVAISAYRPIGIKARGNMLVSIRCRVMMADTSTEELGGCWTTPWQFGDVLWPDCDRNAIQQLTSHPRLTEVR